MTEAHKKYMEEFWNKLEKEQDAINEEKKKNPPPIRTVEEQQLAFDKIWKADVVPIKTEKQIQEEIDQTIRYFGGYRGLMAAWESRLQVYRK